MGQQQALVPFAPAARSAARRAPTVKASSYLASMLGLVAVDGQWFVQPERLDEVLSHYEALEPERLNNIPALKDLSMSAINRLVTPIGHYTDRPERRLFCPLRTYPIYSRCEVKVALPLLSKVAAQIGVERIAIIDYLKSKCDAPEWRGRHHQLAASLSVIASEFVVYPRSLELFAGITFDAETLAVLPEVLRENTDEKIFDLRGQVEKAVLDQRRRKLKEQEEADGARAYYARRGEARKQLEAEAAKISRKTGKTRAATAPQMELIAKLVAQRNDDVREYLSEPLTVARASEIIDSL